MHFTRTTLTIALAALALLACLPASVVAQDASRPAPTGESVPWESRPYKVRVRLSVDHSPVWTKQRTQAIADYIVTSAGRTFGNAWLLEVSLPGAWDHTQVHQDGAKLVDVAIQAVGAAYSVTAQDRERAPWPTPEVAQQTTLLTEVPAAAWTAVAAAFLPEAKVVGVQGDRAVLQGRANSLVRNDRYATARVGAILRLASGAAAGSTAIDGTYFVVERVESSQAICRVVSRQPATQLVAGETRALQASLGDAAPTTLTCVQQGTGAPLAGLQVFGVPLTGEPQLLGATDSHGRVSLASLKQPLAVIAIYNGGVALDQFPLVNGWVRDLETSVKLAPAQVAGQAALASLRDRISAMIVRREIGAARARVRAAEGKAPEAEAMLKQIGETVTAEAAQIQSALDALKKSAEGDAALLEACESLVAALQKATDVGRGEVASNNPPPATSTSEPEKPMPPAGWEQYLSSAGQYEVFLPGKPQEGKFDAMSGGKTVGLQFATANGGKDRPNVTVAYYDAAAAPALADAVALFNQTYQAQPKDQKEITLGAHKGLDLSGTTQSGGSFATRIYAVGNRVYLLMVMAQANAAATPDTKIFFDSFKLTAPAK